MLVVQRLTDLRLAVNLREIEEMVDYVDQIETALLDLFDERPV